MIGGPLLIISRQSEGERGGGAREGERERESQARQ